MSPLNVNLDLHSLYVAIVDPPLPGMISWFPIVCRWLAIAIMLPIIVIVSLDIVAYLIARTLNLRPTTLRLPRSPPTTTSKNILDTDTADGALDSDIAVDRLGMSPLVRPGGLLSEKDGDGDGDGMRVGEGEVLVLPPGARAREREKEEGGEEVDEKIERSEGERSALGLEHDSAKIQSPSPPATNTSVPHLAPPLPINPTSTTSPPDTPASGISNLIDELEHAAKFGTDTDLLPEAVGSGSTSVGRSDEGTVADDALRSLKGRGGKHIEELKQNDEGEKGGERADQGLREDERLGSWEPNKFSPPLETAATADKSEVKDGEVDLEALGRELAEEKERESREGDGDGEDELEKVEFGLDELKDLLKTAQQHKEKGNTAFQSSEPNLETAIEEYKAALAHLPITSLSPKDPKPGDKPPLPSATPGPSGVEEISEAQAEAIQAAESKVEEERLRKEEEEKDPAVKARRETEREIEELKKVVWGNLGAVWVKKGDDKEVVTACSEAIKIDAHYIKALSRRATANDRINTWSSLTSALEDYKTLNRLAHTGSAAHKQSKLSIDSLERRIPIQQKKETDEMLGKLKEMGNSILGKFGLSTDNFKFEQQEGGGYGMKFER